MTTRWGLDLDMSAVRLLRLEGGEWVEAGVEKIDGPDIEDRLKAMLSAIGAGEPAQVFLPRDQILYMDVELADDREARPQIERTLEGRTPYALDELTFDWEETAPGQARVAAIALDTLDEAAAFAEVRDIPVAGYSSLAEDADFPRLPSFDGPVTAQPETEEKTTPPSFASARKPSRPPGSEVEAATAAAKSRITPVAPPVETPAPKPAPVRSPEPVAASQPVVKVDDPTPVMKVKPPSVPLDPGIPIAAPNAPPRVRTDIAAASVSGPAASLTPPKSVRMRAPASHLGIATIFAVAFLITVGIAFLVWNMLPMRPVTSVAQPPAAETGVAKPLAEEPAETVIAAAPPPRPEEAAAPEAEIVTEAEPEPEPAPVLLTDLAPPAAPEIDAEAGTLATVSKVSAPRATPAALHRALRDGARMPRYDPVTPDAPAPGPLAGIDTSAPFPGPEPDIISRIDDIYFASIEPADLSFDAIALPAVRTLRPDPVPQVDPDTGDVTAPGIDPDAVAAALNDALVGPGGLIPTELAASIPDRAPRARPSGFLEDIEREQFGGRTRSELEAIRPGARPASAQSIALEEAPSGPASELAVATSLSPRGRPDGFAALVAEARALIEAERVTASASYDAPDTSSAIEAALDDSEPEVRPRETQRLNIPSSASVARQATLEDAIRLNQINLVGVYGTPTDRRALVRLPSGRYIKVKVGDRVDGGTVASITDNALQYKKGNRLVSLEIPQG